MAKIYSLVVNAAIPVAVMINLTIEMLRSHKQKSAIWPVMASNTQKNWLFASGISLS